MAIAPFKLLDQYGRRIFSGGNTLYKNAQASTKRKTVLDLERDIHRNVSSMGLRTLRTVSKSLYANVPEIQGAIDEMTRLSVGTFIPQYQGSDTAWGDRAESYLYESDKIIDMRGWPFDGQTFNELLVTLQKVEGDFGILLTENGDGWPFVQIIPAHRVHSPNWLDCILTDGKFKGNPIISGVIVGQFGQSIGYRVYSDDGKDFSEYTPQDFLLCFVPRHAEVCRGIPRMAAGASYWLDTSETREYERFAQKAAAMVALIEENPSGLADTARIALDGTPGDTSPESPPGLYSEQVDGGMKLYFPAGKNCGIKTLVADRPSGNQQAFEEKIIRGAFAGLGWSVDFSLDPAKCGGAPLRLVIYKTNEIIHEIQRFVRKIRIRVDGWRIAKAMKAKILPWNDEWFKWWHQGPAEVTADAGYDSAIDQQEYKLGFRTLQGVSAKRGLWWQESRQQTELEVDDLLTRAERLATKHKLDVLQVAHFLEARDANQTAPSTPPQDETKPAGTDESKPKENL